MIVKLSTLLQSMRDAKNNGTKRNSPSNTLLGRLPSWVSRKEQDDDLLAPRNVLRVNRYLRYQEIRLEKLKEQKRYHEIVIRWCILLKNSKSYQVSLFHHADTSWYWNKTSKQTAKDLVSCINKCRRWDMKLTLKRFYLDKGIEKCGIANGLLRPIGAPSIQSKVINKSITNLIYFMYEDKFAQFQHGYRKGKGAYSALIVIWREIFLYKKRFIYEFDFVSFFNRVSPVWVHYYLRQRSWDLADLVVKMISQVQYKFDRSIENLPEESEIHRRGFAKWKNKLKPFIVRRGLPQGLPFSPILATLVLELAPTPKGLTMCADDGVIVSRTDNSEEIKEWLLKLSEKGVRLKLEGTKVVKNEFKFLGVEFNIEKCEARFRDSILCWKDWDLTDPVTIAAIESWFKRVTQWYGKKPSKWHWDVKENSYCEKHYINPYTFFSCSPYRVWDKYLSWILFYSTFWEQYKGLRQFRRKSGKIAGILSISKTSTLCVSSLLLDLKDIKLAKIGRLKFINESTETNEHYSYVNKNKYIEENSWVFRLNRDEPIYPMNSITPQSNIVLNRTITSRTKEGREKLLKGILGEQGWQH